MASLLKEVSILFFILITGTVHTQGLKIEISIPLISRQIDNIVDIDNGFTKRIWDRNTGDNIPNFRLIAKLKKFTGGIEYYYNTLHSDNLNSIEGEIWGLKINSFSFLAGYELFEKSDFTFSVGGGITIHKRFLAGYDDWFPKPWEVWVCYEENKYGAIFWSNITRKIYRNLTLGLNMRYNPMFKKFQSHSGANCLTPHNHDRLNYFISQVSIGYEF